jgi:hypothetical protein
MKKFLLRVVLFLSPVLVAFAITESFFSTEKGDLLKIGYVADVSDYDVNKLFSEEFKRKKYFTTTSELDLSKKSKFKILVIGDSFSDQGNYGYPNYLAESNKNSLLKLDRNYHKNPFETLFGIINGDLLDSIKVEYIVLQSVEREVAIRTNINESAILTIDSLRKIKEAKKSLVNLEPKQTDKLFSDRIPKFITLNIGYNFDDNGFHSETYIVKTKRSLFTVNNNNLLFYFVDLQSLNDNSDQEKLEKLNTQLNFLTSKLSEKGIKLIVLISPDKYGIYYDEITKKEKYSKPQFFEIFNNLPKSYLFVNSEVLLKKAITEKSDLYFYDDTHWSPNASKIIAKEINSLIEENK